MVLPLKALLHELLVNERDPALEWTLLRTAAPQCRLGGRYIQGIHKASELWMTPNCCSFVFEGNHLVSVPFIRCVTRSQLDNVEDVL